MEELFDLPIQTKQRNVSSKPFHGYLNHNLYQTMAPTMETRKLVRRCMSS
ncbi:BnaC03g30390D [Brassica napus]|uniref:(rape) hypothetical protein n=1 Tax=Brassica napus TaxID=3708 RepID=A0A078FYU2_BRANA|nr:unnamed protein product [Brassica napus]CDY17967.1 BnaC03g30390D [Brassica napus]